MKNSSPTHNPLLQTFTNYDQSVPFSKIKVEHYLPALDSALEIAREKLQALKTSNAIADFNNTILALETCSDSLERMMSIFSNLETAEAGEDHRLLAKDIYPKLSTFQSDLSLDPELFKRVKAVYDNRTNLNLDLEKNRLLEKTYLSFVRNGALLSASEKEKLRKIDQELSVLAPQFSENVLQATNAFEVIVSDPKEVEGLPEGALEAAQMSAEAKGHKGKWLFNLQAPSYIPVLTFAKNRNLREKMSKAYGSRSFNDAFDNQENIKKTVQLKYQRAQLLGFKTHADYVLAERMAKDTATVKQFLQKLLKASKKAAQHDLDEVKEFAMKTDGLKEIQPWDFAYYSEKLKEEKYSFNEESLRPFFKLENVVTGVFEHARKLYGLAFSERTDIEVYHPDVKVYEVKEEKSGKYISLFYTDFFPRETKKGGGWMTTYRDQGIMFDEVRRPHVSIVCNFTKPTTTKPSLLSYDEVRTLFHEFGHALHGMLSDCTYRSVSGTNVYWDFVELPSQIMENWASEKEGLDVFAKHYENNTLIPADLVVKIKASQKFQAGWMSLRQLQFAMMDMAWYTTDPNTITDVDLFESLATAETRLLPKIPGTNASCSFSHIFAGGYSAGYYSYKWAEVLDADAFEYFKEKGLFNPEVAKKFKENILSRGGTEHPMELYKKFRGREPDPNALLRRDGLIEEGSKNL
ncbi:MAG: M3 family metallopeptidase [Bdellovibrionota bacterium]